VLSERALTMALLETQSHFMDLLYSSAPLDALLDSLVRAIESLSVGMLGSVLLVSKDGRRLTHGAAPSLPRAYCAAIEGLPIGPRAGSCGTAAHTGEMVVVEDIATDPVWRDYRKVALAHRLRACWSSPILAPDGRVLGTFALYYRAPRRPSVQEKRLVQVAAQLAALAIGHGRPELSGRTAVPHAHLSSRELQIVRLIATGAPVKRIASGLNVTISTVYTHRARIFQKLGVDSNVGVAQYAVMHRLV
jgi:GAF domain-containing protein